MSKTTQEKKEKIAKGKTKVEEIAKVDTREAISEATENEVAAETVESTEEVKETVTKVAKKRSKKYHTAKAKVDVLKFYPLADAIKLAKETSLSKFDGKIEAHVTVFDIGTVGEIAFPHLETSAKKIVILNEAILAEIKEGVINFDILVATPVTMPKLLPFAKVLGPKGLMPNPKTGTLTDKPEEAVKKLSVAKQIIKTEKKAPVVHVVVGKVSQSVEELAENINELVKTIKANKIKKLSICATMGPSVKIAVEK